MAVILWQRLAYGAKTRTCSGTCHRAKLDKCACICGSKYHGISRGGKESPKSIEEADALVKTRESLKL